MRPGLPRPVEAALAGSALVIALPAIVAAGAAIAVTSPGPVLFRQKRIGECGRPFTMYKLRTMRVASGASVTAAGDHRITAVGRVLRKFKIDELPELWNVVRGDMRLVGPRPEVPELVDMRNALWREALTSAPGLTDPVTLRLRNEEAVLRAAGDKWESFYTSALQPHKLRGYVEYQRRRTWRSDLVVLVRTVVAIAGLHRDDNSPEQIAAEIAGSVR